MIHPFIKNKASFAVYGVVWIIIAVLHSLTLIYFTPLNFTTSLLDSLVFNSIFFLLGFALWYPTKFIDFEHNSISSILINHLIGAAITTGIWVGLGYIILTSAFVQDYYLEFLKSSLIWRVVIGLLFYTIVISLNYLIIYYNNFREQLQQESELNTLVKEAELRTLKYQINPHFIFNSLNSISSLTISDPNKAREMTINLSSFLRGTLSKNETQKTKLSEEIENVKLYLKIERVRFEGKFQLIEELSDECKDILIPNMLLQPLFENAIKHGVYESLEVVKIYLKCKREENYLKITVSNDFDKEAAPRKGEGIGLQNIRNRLKLIYNRENLLRVNKSEDKFIVDVLIPLEDR